jgi:hypothetical protein
MVGDYVYYDYLTLMSASSLNNPLNVEMNFCENMKSMC